MKAGKTSMIGIIPIINFQMEGFPIYCKEASAIRLANLPTVAPI